MTSLIYVVVLALLGQARSSVVELKGCSDNATCIDNMAKEFVRSLRQQKTIRILDWFTIEPLGNRQARSNLDPLTRLITTHAISFDWNDLTFRFSNPENRNDALDLEVFESRSAKDISDVVPKKSKSKDEEEIEDKSRVPIKVKPIKRRRTRRKVMQAVLPLLFGMKSTGMVIFGLFMVSVITIKAFMASKMALLVTVGMAMKKVYESYGNGVGLQNHPYLYSQYPIDFPSAASHAYSVSGVSQQFASPELYSPTALGAHPQAHELLQQSDVSAQQSQQAPTQLLVNSTRAAERWDGKSKLLKFFEPVVETIRNFVDPIASIFYGAMPTFRGRNSHVSTTKGVEPDVEKLKKPREILVPQPRHIAQRKMANKKILRNKPKKYVEFKVDLDRLKQNKDYLDYVKTKKYKYNYPHTLYYPRIKYFVNPNVYAYRQSNNRLLPYRKPILRRNILVNSNNVSETTTSNILSIESTDWRPVVMYNVTDPVTYKKETRKRKNKNKNIRKLRRKKEMKKRKREKRSLDSFHLKAIHEIDKESKMSNTLSKDQIKSKGFSTFFEFLTDPFSAILRQIDGYADKVVHDTLKSKEPPKYYSIAYNFLMYCLDAIDGLFEVHEAIRNYVEDGSKAKRKIKKKNKKKPSNETHKDDSSKVIETNNKHVNHGNITKLLKHLFW